MFDAAHNAAMMQGLAHATVHAEWQAQLPVVHQHRSAVIAANGASLCCLNVCMKDACHVGDLQHTNVILLRSAAYFAAMFGFWR